MEADRPGRRPFAGVRARTTAVSVVVVALVLIVGAVAVTQIQRSLLQDDLDAALMTRADDLSVLVSEAPDLDTLVLRRQEEAFVQVVDPDGNVVAGTDNAVDVPPEADISRTGFRSTYGTTIDPDEEFRVLVTPLDGSGSPATLVLGVSAETIDENLAALVNALVLVIPVLVAAVGIVTWIMMGRVLRPVEAIRTRVETISEGELDQRVPEPATGDEIDRLARTMNRMLARLESAFDRQRQFVADASHELKSPLTAMQTQLDVDAAHPDTASEEATRELVGDEVAHLRDLVGDLLFLASVDERAVIRRELVDLDDLVIVEADRGPGAVGVTLDLSAVSAGQVEGDPVQLARVVRNLLDNALHHAHSLVAVSLEETDGRVLLAVSDDGQGVPLEDSELIFERFRTRDAARTPDGRTGTGLGLAIARDVATAHGGTLTLDVGYHPGARFVLDLPTASP